MDEMVMYKSKRRRVMGDLFRTCLSSIFTTAVIEVVYFQFLPDLEGYEASQFRCPSVRCGRSIYSFCDVVGSAKWPAVILLSTQAFLGMNRLP